jgi:hypothetical protein
MLNGNIEGMLKLFELEEDIEDSTLMFIKFYLLSTTNYQEDALKNLLVHLADELADEEIRDFALSMTQNTKSLGIFSLLKI